jgi:hypothetical protein
MSQQHTYAEIANNWALWNEFVNTDGTMTREEFEAMSEADKVSLQVEAFGAEA